MRPLIGVLCKMFNFFIVMYLNYILHYGYLLRPAFHAAMADASIAKARQLYKDNPAPCRMQAD